MFARGNEALVQVLGKWCRVPSRGLEAPLLAYSISINGRLVFEVEGDRAEYLGKSQGLEFSQDGFRGESFVETLDNGIERYASTCQIVATVALFHVFSRHHANYSGIPLLVGRRLPQRQAAVTRPSGDDTWNVQQWRDGRGRAARMARLGLGEDTDGSIRVPAALCEIGTAGLPGLVLPAGLTKGGLPVAMEFDGPSGTDRPFTATRV